MTARLPVPADRGDGGRVTPIRVVLADDQQLIRTALRMVIADIEDVEVVGEAADGEEAVTRTEELRPDVVVMDIRMPGVDGIEATRRITTGAGKSKIVVLTTFDDDDYVYGALRAGAWVSGQGHGPGRHHGGHTGRGGRRRPHRPQRHPPPDPGLPPPRAPRSRRVHAAT